MKKTNFDFKIFKRTDFIKNENEKYLFFCENICDISFYLNTYIL